MWTKTKLNRPCRSEFTFFTLFLWKFLKKLKKKSYNVVRYFRVENLHCFFVFSILFRFKWKNNILFKVVWSKLTIYYKNKIKSNRCFYIYSSFFISLRQLCKKLITRFQTTTVCRQNQSGVKFPVANGNAILYDLLTL